MTESGYARVVWEQAFEKFGVTLFDDGDVMIDEDYHYGENSLIIKREAVAPPAAFLAGCAEDVGPRIMTRTDRPGEAELVVPFKQRIVHLKYECDLFTVDWPHTEDEVTDRGDGIFTHLVRRVE